ncbi:MAG: DUF418 domain-containing protein, partial [Ferruginibacter sp.]|nr:DUF418 domain-containing protein [Ferruginibacter sp.]
MNSTTKTNRIELVDALRGFAILCIVVLHNMERFEFNYSLQDLPLWVKYLDKQVLFTGYFLFGGKAYAIFALLFGFSFYIQNNNQQLQGKDYRLRFFWRMVLLLIFGFINTAFYQGDILTLYAIFGLILIPTCNLSNKTIFIIAIILMVQPIEIGRTLYALANPGFVPSPNLSDSYYKEIAAYMNNGNFFDYVIGNVTLGKTASLLWSWEYGRFMQAPALFLLGFLAGRKKLFLIDANTLRFWKNALKYSIIIFIPLYLIIFHLANLVKRPALLNPLKVILVSWANFAFILILVAIFIMLFQKSTYNKILSNLVPFGKMGLTNYILQSIAGSTLYYKYGFGLY